MANKYAGTKTEKNLWDAFAGESMARNKYTYFASVAKKAGYEQIAALFLVVKGMQDKQMEVLEAIKMFSDKGLKSTGGLSNNSNGAPKNVRPIMDSALVAMCMMQGLPSAIVNPNDLRLMETIKSCDIYKNHVLYSDSYQDL